MNSSNQEIMVSISCITYNHAPYIRQCLDGFIMQKTNFAFEVLIHDDASTDGTTEIIKEYEAKYPDIIKPIYEEENQWVKGRRGSAVFNFPRAKGKYIAMCEGDDYWIDPLKLQKQVDFMDSHPNHSLCFHAYEELYNDGIKRRITRYKNSLVCCPKKDIINAPGSIMTTNSMFFRRKLLADYPEWAMTAPIGDAPLTLVLTTKGYVSYINEVMSCYRISSIGSWTSKMSLDFKKRKKHYCEIMKMWKDFDVWSAYEFHRDVYFNLKRNWLRLVYLNVKMITMALVNIVKN